MKIQAATPINNISIHKVQKNENIITSNNPTKSDSILRNSLSEAIGRSQLVSFSGENRIKGPIFEHSCSEFLGDKENIYYNKQDGSFRHTVVGRDGQLKRQEEYYPILNKEIVTKVNDGEKTITTKTPSMFRTEKYNENGKQIYFEESTPSGKKMIITDFEIGRRIIAQETNGKNFIQVIDLKTNLPVTTGDLVLQRFYDKETDSYLTENLITGQILKKEKYRANNKYDSVIEYAPGTGNVTREYVYDPKSGGYFDSTYYDTGARKKLVKTSKNGRKKDIYKFAQDGKTILSRVILEFGKYDKLECETVYIPGTDIIDRQTVYGEEVCTKYKFRKSPNVPQSAENYIDGRLVEEIKFQKDGETYEYSRQYKEDGAFRDNFYNRYGYKTHSKSYTADNFLYQYAEYNPDTEYAIRSIDYDKLTGTRKETLYDEKTGYAKKIILSDANGRTKEINEFFIGTTNLKSKIEYNADGSFLYTRFDETGAVLGRDEYNADGTKKYYNQSGSGRQNYGNYSYTTGSRSSTHKETALSEEEVIEHILNVTSSTGKSISEITPKEWAKLAEILEIENPNDLMRLDKETYRRLSKKFHPDLQQGEAQKAYGEKLFKIIHNLYNYKMS